MSNPIDTMGRCVVCGKKCESSAGCDCTTINAYGAGSPTTMLAPDAQALIAAKDAEIELLKMELDGELAGRRDITKLLEGDTDEPRWKWIRIAISDLKDSLAAEATRAEFLESKCAKMRELLGECRADGLESFELRNRIDAILESEEA